MREFVQPERLTASGRPFDAPGLSLGIAAGFLSVASLVILLTPSVVAAPAGDWGASSEIETHDQESRYPQIGVDAFGNAIAVWSQWNTSGSWNFSVWANRFTPGSGWGDPTMISAYPYLGHVPFPQVAVEPGGNAVAVWYQRGVPTSVWANRYAIGVGWGTPELVGEAGLYVPSVLGTPKVAMDGLGNAVALWTDDYSVLFNRYVNGSGWGAAEFVYMSMNGGANRSENWDVAIDKGGNITVVWDRYEYDPQVPQIWGFNIWARRYVAGSGWGSAARIEADDGDAIAPAVTTDPSGNVTAVWRQGDSSRSTLTRYYVSSNRFIPGAGWGSPTPIEGNTGLSLSALAVAPHVAANANGRVIAVWWHDNGARTNVWANGFGPELGWGNATLVEANNSADAERPDVAIDSNGFALATWTQWVGTTSTVWGNWFVPGHGWGTPLLLEPENSGPAASVRVAIDEGGNATAVWEQFDGTHRNIWANRDDKGWAINIDSDPPGMRVRVGGIIYTAPLSFRCATGRLLDAPSPQGNASARFVFSAWSDGGNESHAILCDANKSVVASFVLEYLVSFSTSPPALELVIDSAPAAGEQSLWWRAGSTHLLSAPVPQTLGDTRYQLSSWSDGSLSNRTLLVDRPILLVAYFLPVEFLVHIGAVPGPREVFVNGFLYVTPVDLWLPAASQLTVDAPSPQMGTPGTRYQFATWDDGGTQNHSMLLSSPSTLTVAFAVEYTVTVWSSPLDFLLEVDGLPLKSPQGFWWAADAVHTLGGTSSMQEVGHVRYALSSWRDVAAINRSFVVAGPETLEAIFAPMEYLVTIDTTPQSLQLEVDGAAVASPITTWWPAESTHAIATHSPQEAGSARLVFSGWSDNLGISHSLRVDGPIVLSASFVTQYPVTVESSLPGVYLTIAGRLQQVPQTSWWVNGSTSIIGAPSTVPISSEARARWSSWSDGGSQSHTIVVGGPITVRADFIMEFLLTAESPFILPECDHADCWYANGTMATVRITKEVPAGQGTRRVFVAWTGDIADANASTTVLLDQPKRVMAVWKLQYELRIDSVHGFATGAGWYDEGATAHLVNTWPTAISNGQTYTFGGWRGALEADARAVDVPMDGPKVVTLNWLPAERPGSTQPIQIAGAGFLALLLAAITGVVSSRVGFGIDGLVMAPLFTRLRKIDVTSQYQRGRLIQFIDDNPGASYSEIRRRLQIGNGGCAYHLRVLERNGEIRRVAHGASVRFYPVDYKVDPEALPPLTHMQRQLLGFALARPEMTAGDFSEALTDEGHAVNQSTLLYNLKALAREKGLMSMRREGGRTLYFATATQRIYLEKRLREEAEAERILDQRLDAGDSNEAPGLAPDAAAAHRGPSPSKEDG